jgi:hypothetical protein
VKEFLAAANEEKKAVFARIEEEVEKLTGFTARYSMCGCLLSIFNYFKFELYNAFVKSALLIAILF